MEKRENKNNELSSHHNSQLKVLIFIIICMIELFLKNCRNVTISMASQFPLYLLAQRYFTGASLSRLSNINISGKSAVGFKDTLA